MVVLSRDDVIERVGGGIRLKKRFGEKERDLGSKMERRQETPHSREVGWGRRVIGKPFLPTTIPS